MSTLNIRARLCEALWRVGGAWLFRLCFNLRHPGAVRILSGHRAIDEGGPLSETDRRDLARGCLRLSEFRARIDYLQRRYTVVSLQEVAGRLTKGQRAVPNALIVTFDDGFRDVADHVLPLMIERRIPCTIFLATEWLGRPGMMKAEQVRELAVRGGELVEWGAHGVTHKVLTQMSQEEAEHEIVLSRERIESLVGKPVRLFCYPDGRYNADLPRLLRARGFAAACATGRRVNVGRVDRYALQRIPFESEPLSRFAFRVAGWT